MSKQFAGVLAAIVLAFVGIFLVSTHKTDSNNASAKKSAATPTQHIMGSTASNVTLVEYGDYQCIHCEQYYQVVKASVDQFKDQIQFQFRNFPIPNAHPNAFAAARAAEAAALQNKFWEMHDTLYDPGNWQGWTTASNPTTFFDQYAQQLGLDTTKFKTDFASSNVNNLINADLTEGNRVGVKGTPAFFLDGKSVEIAPNKAAFEKIITAEIAKKQPKVKTQSGSGQTAVPAATDNSSQPQPTVNGQ